MENRAIGMIEVNGLLGAIEAADSALKAATVSLLRVSKVGAGLITVLIVGEVSAVSSAVDAAVASLGVLNRKCSSHVIPRLSPEVFAMLGHGFGRDEERPCPEREMTERAEDEGGSEWSGDIEGLASMKVMELRRLARSVDLTSMTKKEIRYAGKAELIAKLAEFFESSGGDGE